MRVIAGKFKSRQLKAVPSQLTRPTTDKNKENLFNMIGPYFQGGTCLDLFAGSGGLGIEAVSRGIDELYSVDKQYRAFMTIKENVANLKINDHVHLYKADYSKALELFAKNHVQFDLVFLDPPYGMKIHQKILDFMAEHHMLKKDCIIVIEDLKEERIDVTSPFVLKKQHYYGMTSLQILSFCPE